jgi:hypothetical protein
MNKILSWSEISCFEYSPEEWHKRYILKEKSPSSPEMEFGIMIDKKIQEDPTFLPEIPRYPIMQHKFFAEDVGMSVGFVGYADTCLIERENDDFRIRDYKTGRYPWNQYRADETGQLTLYAMLMSHIEKIPVEKIRLFIDWIPTKKLKAGIFMNEKKGVQSFETRRTEQSVFYFKKRIERTLKEMEKFALHKNEQKEI